jgi:hypothetical protein
MSTNPKTRKRNNNNMSSGSPKRTLRSNKEYRLSSPRNIPIATFQEIDRTNRTPYSGKSDKFCIELPQGGFVKLSSTFKDELEQLNDIYYEFPKNKFKSLPNGPYFFVLNKSGKTKYRLGLIEVNPAEYFTYHYTLITLMAIKNKNNKIEPFIISGELVKDNNNITWSDFSGTYKDLNMGAIKEDALTKYSLKKTISNDEKYIKYINSEINPIMETLLGKKCKFESFKVLIDARNKETISNYLKSCKKINHKKLLFVNERDCLDNKNSLGNICELDQFYSNYNKELEKRRAKIISHIPLFKKAVTDYTTLSEDELQKISVLSDRMKMIVSRYEYMIPKFLLKHLNDLKINLDDPKYNE